jgi:hypothetical protein
MEDKSRSRIYKIIIGVEAVIIVLLAILFFTNKSSVDAVVLEKEKTVQINTELQNELDSLMSEHSRIKSEYGSLSSQLTAMITAQAKEIEQLINSQADYRRVKRKLDALRQITQGYVLQIDSLYKVNKLLTDENYKIKGDLESAQKYSEELVKEKDNLSTKINDAAFLSGYNIVATGYSIRSGNKQVVTDRARKVNMIRIKLTIGANPLVSAGQKDVYVRIARPDNIILTQGSYSFIYQGQRIQYTEKTVINYNQKATAVTIDYSRDNIDLPAGKYNISVFADDHELGQTSLTLR